MLNRPDGDPATPQTVAPGTLRVRSHPTARSPKPTRRPGGIRARSHLGAASSFGLRRDDLIVKDGDMFAVEDRLADYEAWRDERGRASSARGARPGAARPDRDGLGGRGRRSSASTKRSCEAAGRSRSSQIAGAEKRPRGPRFGTLVHAVLATVPLDAADDLIARTAETQARIINALGGRGRRRRGRRLRGAAPRPDGAGARLGLGQARDAGVVAAEGRHADRRRPRPRVRRRRPAPSSSTSRPTTSSPRESPLPRPAAAIRHGGVARDRRGPRRACSSASSASRRDLDDGFAERADARRAARARHPGKKIANVPGGTEQPQVDGRSSKKTMSFASSNGPAGDVHAPAASSRSLRGRGSCHWMSM